MDFDPFKYKISQLNALPPSKGNVLVAEPFMDDPYFKRSVVLLAENNEEGTVGFILNHALDIKINELIEDFPFLESKVFLGGPVQSKQLFYIHRNLNLIPDSFAINDEIGWNSNFEILGSLLNKGSIQEKDIRIFLGYAGWEKNQLKEELATNSWLIQAIKSELILDLDSDNLWKRILKNADKEIAQLANFPENPSLN